MEVSRQAQNKFEKDVYFIRAQAEVLCLRRQLNKQIDLEKIHFRTNKVIVKKLILGLTFKGASFFIPAQDLSG